MQIGLRIVGGFMLLIGALVMFGVWMNRHTAQGFLSDSVAAHATVTNLLTVEGEQISPGAPGTDAVALSRTIHGVRAKWKTPSGQDVEALATESLRLEDQAKLRVGGPVEVLYQRDNPQSFMLRLTAERVAADRLPFLQVGGALAFGVLLLALSFVIGRRPAATEAKPAAWRG